MSSFASAFVPFRRRKEQPERMNQNDWAMEWFTFQGNAYPIAQDALSATSGKEADTEFENYVQNAYKKSGIVYAAITTRMAIFTQARFQYQSMRNGRPGKLFGKPELNIFEKPWGSAGGTTAHLLARMMQDADLGGNFYAVQEGTGSAKKPFRIRRLRPDWVDIVLTAPPAEAVASDIEGYLYRPGNTMDDELWEFYPVDGSNGKVCHWAPRPDPTAQYRGMSWLQSVLVDIQADVAMIKHKNMFFKNAATPAISVSLSDRVTKKQFDEFMKGVNKSSAGVDNAYKTLYLGGGADVKVIGANLQQMDFTKTGGHGETRICAAAGIHPTLVGVAENLHGTPLSSNNFKPAKDLLIDGHMRGLWASAADALSVFVPELTNARLWYDDRDIPFLRQDRAEVAQIKNTEMTTIVQGITIGFTPDSVVKAMLEEDWDLLEHTGLFSVQLVPPGQQNPNAPDAPPDGAPADPNAPGAPPSKPNGNDANTPDKADKGKSNQPPTPSDDTQ